MARYSVLVDGFNLYHAIDGISKNNHEFSKYKWLNLRKLIEYFIGTKNTIETIHYFTALPHWDIEKVKRHQRYIKALETVGVEVVYGKFKHIPIVCKADCKKIFNKPVEKQTDVNISVTLQRLAYEDRFDRAVIVSGDSDLIPPISYVKQTFPQKEIGILIPIGRRAEELKSKADFFWRLKTMHLKASRFEDSITLSMGEKLECPDRWRSGV